MKLQEIIQIQSQPYHGVDLSKINNFVSLSDSFMGSLAVQIGNAQDFYVFKVLNDEVLIAFIACTKIEDFGTHKEVLMIKRTFCDSAFRNKGIMTNLYRYLYSTLGYTLISDVHQSPETVKIWNKLKKEFEVKMIDLKTKSISDIDDSVYAELSKAFIIESSPFNSFNGILSDYIFDIGAD